MCGLQKYCVKTHYFKTVNNLGKFLLWEVTEQRNTGRRTQVNMTDVDDSGGMMTLEGSLWSSGWRECACWRFESCLAGYGVLSKNQC